MPKRPPRRGLVAGVIVSLVLASCAEGASSANNQEKPLPKFEDAKKMLVRHFQNLPGYQPGGILARCEVEPIFKHLKQMGWQVADSKAILDRVPADDSFLVRELRAPDWQEVHGPPLQIPRRLRPAGPAQSASPG